MAKKPELIFVSGLSGAGKSVALDMLEDLEYFCIDNLPLPLAASLNPSTLGASDKRYRRIAIGIDARASATELAHFPSYLAELRQAHPDYKIRLIFLHADTDVLLRRFSETRRRHPLSIGRIELREAVEKERTLLAPIADIADIQLETSATNLHELREQIRTTLRPGDGRGNLLVVLRSFGFKHGAPHGLDLMFDVRCLPNPHWEPTLRGHTGLEAEVQNWLADQPGVADMEQDILDFLRRWIPQYAAQDRHYLTVGIGCTGGRHRSVYITERLGAGLRDSCALLSIRHTELP